LASDGELKRGGGGSGISKGSKSGDESPQSKAAPSQFVFLERNWGELVGRLADWLEKSRDFRSSDVGRPSRRPVCWVCLRRFEIL
jgi:hypothetical protein